jgi:hypothetical protein
VATCDQRPENDTQANRGVRLIFQRATMPLQAIPSSFPSSCLPRLLTVAMSSHDHSSRWPAHRQACKCLCSSSYLGRASTAPLVAANQARASARLPVLVGATWPYAWLLPCAGLAPRCRPFQLQGELGTTKHVNHSEGPRLQHDRARSCQPSDLDSGGVNNPKS